MTSFALVLRQFLRNILDEICAVLKTILMLVLRQFLRNIMTIFVLVLRQFLRNFRDEICKNHARNKRFGVVKTVEIRNFPGLSPPAVRYSLWARRALRSDRSLGHPTPLSA